MSLDGNLIAMWEDARSQEHRGSKKETQVDGVVGATDYNKVSVVMG